MIRSKGSKMRKLLWAILIAAAAWSAWWFIGSTAKDRALTAWLTNRQAAGWIATTQSLDVTGYPNRFDTKIAGLELANPAQGWAWSAPFFQILALSYKPNHIIAVWPNEQAWSTPNGTTRITSDDMRGSVKFVPSTSLALDETTIDIRNLRLAGADWEAGLESAIFATRRSASGTNAHDLAFTANNLDMPEFWRSLVNRAGNLPDVFSEAALETTLSFDRPWDRTSIENQQPLLTGFDLQKLRLHWGELQLDAIGDVKIDTEGYFVGELQLRVKNWQDILQMYVDSGALSADAASLIHSGLNVLAMLSGDPRTLNAPLTFTDGRAYIGPVWVGYAPRLAH
jgi:hypothetical protein